MKKIQQVSVKALITKNNKVLMLRDHKGKWELPGGRINFGEHPIEALEREIQEELNTKENVKASNFFDVWDFCSIVSDVKYHFIILVFECDLENKKININNEHDGVEFLGERDIEIYDMRNGYKETLRKFFRNRV